MIENFVLREFLVCDGVLRPLLAVDVIVDLIFLVFEVRYHLRLLKTVDAFEDCWNVSCDVLRPLLTGRVNFRLDISGI